MYVESSGILVTRDFVMLIIIQDVIKNICQFSQKMEFLQGKIISTIQQIPFVCFKLMLPKLCIVCLITHLNEYKVTTIILINYC